MKWESKALGDVCEISAGVTLGRKLPHDGVRKVPYLRVANVKDGLLDLSEVKQTDATEIEIARGRLAYGDVLLTEGGDPDKLGRGTFWREQLPECILQNHVFRLRFDLKTADPEFLAYQFGSAYGKAYFLAHAKQTTGIATINRGVLCRFPLRVIPLPEQRRIATRLREQLAEVKHARAALQSQLDAAEKLRAAYLHEAFTSVAASRWSQATPLATVIRETKNGLYKPDTFYGRGTRILKMFNIGRLDGRWELSRVDKLEVTPNELADYGLRVGDLLVNRVNSRELVGKSALADPETEGAVFESKNMRVRFDESKVFPRWIALWFNGEFCRRQIEQRLKQIVGMATINREDVLALQISLPTLAEQQRIAATLDAMQEPTQRVVTDIKHRLAAVEKLPAALLREAFSEAS